MHMCTYTTANVDHIQVAGITLCFSGSVTQKMFEKTETIGCTMSSGTQGSLERRNRMFVWPTLHLQKEARCFECTK